MRNWFPLTDYDFYGYLASGFVLLFALDLAYNGGAVAFRPEWTFVQVVLAVAFAYAVGQLAAWPSSILLEHFLAHRVFRSPFDIQVGAVPPRWIEQVINAVVTGQDYRPLGEDAIDNMVARAAAITGRPASYYAKSSGRLFQPAYEFSKSVPETKERMDQFRNLYGLTRNLAFTGLLSAVVLAHGAGATDSPELRTWAVVALVAGVGMLARYLKFYGAFASEVTRCFAYHETRGDATRTE